jgi:hypothetical protein
LPPDGLRVRLEPRDIIVIAFSARSSSSDFFTNSRNCGASVTIEAIYTSGAYAEPDMLHAMAPPARAQRGAVAGKFPSL